MSRNKSQMNDKLHIKALELPDFNSLKFASHTTRGRCYQTVSSVK